VTKKVVWRIRNNKKNLGELYRTTNMFLFEARLIVERISGHPTDPGSYAGGSVSFW
jgi:hypothetical protein